MARPQKNGLDYFPLQTDTFDVGSELRPVIHQYGGEGFSVYAYVLSTIYRNGYFYKTAFFDDYISDISTTLKCKEETVREILTLLVRLDILAFFKEGDSVVITSRGVQKRYVEVTKSRKRDLANFLEKVHDKYWMLSDHETIQRMGKSDPKKNEILNEVKCENCVKRGFSENNESFSEKNPANVDNSEKIKNLGTISGENVDKKEFFQEKLSLFQEKLSFFPEKSSLLSFSLSKSNDMNRVNEDDESNCTSNLKESENVQNTLRVTECENVEKRDELSDLYAEMEQERAEKKINEALGKGKLERLKNGEKSQSTQANVGKSEFDLEAYNRFQSRWNLSLINTANYSTIVMEIDWDALSKKIEQSKWLRQNLSMDFIVGHYYEIMRGKYDDFKKKKSGMELLDEIAAEYRQEENNGNEK